MQMPFRTFLFLAGVFLWDLLLGQIIKTLNINSCAKLSKLFSPLFLFLPRIINKRLRVSMLNSESLVSSFLSCTSKDNNGSFDYRLSK